MAMDRDRLLAHLRRLGTEFRKREMFAHVKKLRAYYALVERGLTQAPLHEADVHWSEALVVDWLQMLRVPPYDRAYALRPRGSPCPRCAKIRDVQSNLSTVCVFPGGAKVRCYVCGDSWLEADA